MKIRFTSLVELLQYRAENQGTQLAFSFLEDGEKKEISITYAELHERACVIASNLLTISAPGDRVLLLYHPGIEYIAAFMGCLYATVIPVPAYPPDGRNSARLRSIINDADSSLALSTNVVVREALNKSNNTGFTDKFNLGNIRWVATDPFLADKDHVWESPKLQGDAVAFLQYTSGSTSNPKGVIITHQNLLYNSALEQKYLQHTEESCMVSWLPPFHDMGLIGVIIQSLYVGMPAVLMSPMSFLKKPFRWLQAISNCKLSESISSGAPNFAYELCCNKITDEQLSTLDLGNWKIAFNGAEPVRHSTIENFSRKFAACGFKSTTMLPVYGLAEATLIASSGDAQALPIIKDFSSEKLEKRKAIEVNQKAEEHREGSVIKMVGCGNNLSGQELVIVNPDTGLECPEGEVGEIYLAGASVGKGYWNNEAETEKAFRAYVSGKGPYLRTGDIGFLLQGELFLTGRLKDLIIIRGKNHYPQDIEFTVNEAHPAIRPGNGAAFSIGKNGEEKLVIVQEIKREFRRKFVKEEVVDAIMKAVSLNHSLQTYKVCLIEPSSFPKTSSGKLQRQACKKQFLNAELKEIYEKEMVPSLPA